MITQGCQQSVVEHNVMCSFFIIKTAQAELDNIWKISFARIMSAFSIVRERRIGE
jgi:hypothetical protein